MSCEIDCMTYEQHGFKVKPEQNSLVSLVDSEVHTVKSISSDNVNISSSVNQQFNTVWMSSLTR